MKFSKYHGTGNDFIIIDNRLGDIKLSTSEIAALCHRRFGIGADGLMLLELALGYDFKMVYYNADGHESSLCGNGGRCITAFAKESGLITTTARFLAIDGEHTATINPDGLIGLHINDVLEINIYERHTILNTGSPHYVTWVHDAGAIDVYNEGKKIRQREEYQPSGINVNFAQLKEDNKLVVRTYERGVEDETLSCGTGVTAAAIAAAAFTTGIFVTTIETPGGILQVSFTKHEPLKAVNVVLTGPVVKVFEGKI